VENIEISRALTDVADLLEIMESNPFRIRAYRNAAHTVGDHGTPLSKLVAQGTDLKELPGIGKDIARHIEVLVTTGELPLLDELARKVPVSLIELMRLPGVGARRARKLWKELGIETMVDLESAARDGRIESLSGFGKKTQEKILVSIERYRHRIGRMKLGDADQHVAPLIDYMRSNSHVERIDVAGSYRRRKETVGDVDVLVVTNRPTLVAEHFAAYPEVKQVEGAGDTRCTVQLRSGLQVDLRIVPPGSYGAAMQYFTGSKEHNVRVRTRAVTRGLRVSEYGVFRGGDEAAKEGDPWAGEQVAGEDEAAVYEALDLDWIPPELREKRGEVEASSEGRLPALVALEDIRGDLQMHSTWSDGRESIERMLNACLFRGYEYLAITDHSKALAMTGGLDAVKLRQQWDEITDLQARYPHIHLLRGMEVDILADGSLDLEDEMLAQLDVVLVSVHSRFDLPAAAQTARIVQAVRHPAVNIVGHPTGRQINRRDPIKCDMDAIFECAVEHSVAVEINAHPDRLDLNDVHVLQARDHGCRFVISTDAHRAADLDLMSYGVEQARRGWLEKRDVINTLPYEELVAILAKGS
jgi:DNA polymerase (family 10)